MAEDTSRIDALRRARERRPWTVDLVVESAADPAAFKETTPACAVCPRPCDADEVCATAVAKSGDLLESMGRDQAYHLIESAMKRLRTRDEAAFRTADRERPNTFLELDGDHPVEPASDEGRRATTASDDERPTKTASDDERPAEPDNE